MRRATTCGMLVLAGLLTFVKPIEAAPITIHAGDIFRITFTTNPASFSRHGVPNLIMLTLLTSVSGFGGSGITGYGAELYDGSTLLGSYHQTGSPQWLVPLFKSATSPSTNLNPTVVDFTSILAGTIVGQIDFHLDSGTLTFDDPAAGGAPLLTRAVNSGGGISDVNWATYSTQVIRAVPESSSGLFFAIGVAVLIARRYLHS